MIIPQEFQKIIYTYYHTHKRMLPWRWETDPYKILVSEVMLQQTQVSRVIPKYNEWLTKFPTFNSLAYASLRDVLTVWQGMGYNRRAKYLREISQIIVNSKQYSFMLENSKYQIANIKKNNSGEKWIELLQKLSGIGQATASAILAYAFNVPVIFLETNIRSVYLFHFFKNTQNVSDKELLAIIEKTLDYANPREWYYALTDYGAMLKQKEKFTNIQSKHYTKQSKFGGSRRQLRGMILKILLTYGPSSLEQIKSYVPEDERVEGVLHELKVDGIIMRDSETSLFKIY